MEDEVDSIDQIKALSDQRRTNRVHDEPIYQIGSNGGNSTTSFGAGGRISQVIDPEFRTPITIINQQQQQQTHLFGQMSTPTPNNQPLHQTFMSSATTKSSFPVGSSFSTLTTTIASPFTTTLPTTSATTTTTTTNNSTNIIFSSSSSSNTLFTSGYFSANAATTSSNSATDSRPTIVSSTPSGAQTTPTSSIPFSTSSDATSFSHLAKKHSAPSAVPSSSTVTSSTLHEYGPPVTLGYKPPISSIQLSYQPTPPLHSISSRPLGPYEINSRPFDTHSNAPSGRLNEGDLSRPLGFIPSTSRSTLHVNCPPPPKNVRKEDGPLFSPPAPPSPPLDQIMNPVRADNPIPQPTIRSSNQDAPIGKIPKKQKTTAVVDKYDELSMLELIDKHNGMKSKLSFAERRRQDIEKSLNDMTRNSQGKNVELDAMFRQRKDEQRRCHDEIIEIQSTIKKVSNKLLTKYGHRVNDKQQSSTSAPQPPPARQRARMSTGGSRYEPKSIEPEKKSISHRDKYLLTLSGSKFWCKLCDYHLDNFDEYCEHLHKREHLLNMNRSVYPWRRTKENFDRRKTYDTLKSICAIVNNESENNHFSLASYDKSLNPMLDDKDRRLKNTFAARERGHFEDKDPLFSIKGYQNLIPITGFYCQLCDQAYCDSYAAEQHVKSYEHNYKHAKSVAKDHMSEETFRSLQEKSYKKQHPQVSSTELNKSAPLPASSTSTTTASTSSSSANNNTTSSTTGSKIPRANALPIAQYKKSTSHIVDEHEVIADKFAKRPLSADHAPKRVESAKTKKQVRSRAMIESDSEGTERDESHIRLGADDEEYDVPSRTSGRDYSPKKKKLFRKNNMPEILPIRDSRTKPSALKRLKTTSESVRLNKKKPYFSSSDTEASENDVQILEEIHLNKGDPDSPFPGLDLVVTGNVHSAVLKDSRLAAEGRVVMNRINIEDYKDLMLDSSTLWTRINHLMTKKEPAQLERLKKTLREKISTRATYFNNDGELVPINMGEGSAEESETDVEGGVNTNGSAGDTKKSKGLDSVTEEEEYDNDNYDDDDDEEEEEVGKKARVKSSEQHKDLEQNDKHEEKDNMRDDVDLANKVDDNFTMAALEDFFCEKR